MALVLVPHIDGWWVDWDCACGEGSYGGGFSMVLVLVQHIDGWWVDWDCACGLDLFMLLLWFEGGPCRGYDGWI
jgi:hypothetical protein